MAFKLSRFIIPVIVFSTYINVLYAEVPPITHKVTLRLVQNDLISASVEVKNNSEKIITEISGYIDLYNTRGEVADTESLQVLHAYDRNLRTGETHHRDIIIDRPADIGGTARYRITKVKFLNDIKSYMLCPFCGNLIPLD